MSVCWGALQGAITIDQFEPASWLVVATGLAALLAVAVDALWRWSRNVVTIVHEGGHAVAALLTGRVGLLGVALLAADQVTVLLWAAVAVMAGMLLMVRNLYGALVLVVVGGAFVAISLYASPDVQAAFGYGMTWFLLLGGVRPVVELWRQRRDPAGRGSDAAQLAGLTHVPTTLWTAFFGVVALGALAGGAYLLLT
jgi:hypothetical protein